MHRAAALFSFTTLLCLTFFLTAGDPQKKEYTPKIASASREGMQAIQRIRPAANVKVGLWAAEPLLANPVAFCFDEKGRCYVAETFRLGRGVTDNRSHMYWLQDELACRTVADRVAMYRKHLGKKFASYSTEHDRVRLVEDRDGDGRADHASVFADGFNRPEDGLGSGLLARNGSVYYTCIPDLWLLKDTQGTGRANLKHSLHTGFGVHVAFIGHDLHGLKIGPDGRLYFSIGDRGLHVSPQISSPDTGAVLRCELDGSNLEIFATGLRNPQELAFNEYGDLFTGDNNADSGDKARWVHLVQGGDSGWRIGYQYLKSPPAALGPWNAEKLWHTQHAEQPAWHLPPLAHIGNGPSGLTYHPGVSLLPERWKDHFFLCDFRGGSGGSGIHAFQLRQKGASYEVGKPEQFVWSVLATDCDFGPDGGFYLSDWVEGWGLTGKGRIYKLADPARAQNAKVAEVKKLLAEGFAKRPVDELTRLLGHDDLRVRQEAQLALAARRAENELAQTTRTSDNLLARMHAIWALGQIGRAAKYPERITLAQRHLEPLLTDKTSEVRGQVAKVLGEMKYVSGSGHERMLALLKDTESRVRFFAAQALSQCESVAADAQPLAQLLRDNADRDPYLRHAGVLALAAFSDQKNLLSLAQDASPAVRRGVLLALRRQKAPEVVRFLNDTEPSLIAEAARAINDVPIPEAFPQLAALANRTNLPDNVTYRALNAHFRLGQKENAQALAAYAARSTAPESMRLEALKHLGQWAKPAQLERVVGLWRPLGNRPQADAVAAVRTHLGGLFGSSARVREEATKVAAKYGIKEVGPALLTLVQEADSPASARISALQALGSLKDARFKEAVEVALRSNDPRVRAQGRRGLVDLDPARALPVLESALEKGELAEQQGALAALANLPDAAVNTQLARWLDRVAAGKARALQLDVLEAGARRQDPALKKRVQQIEAALAGEGPLGKYRPALEGGDAENGRRLFLERSELSCVRCHKLNGTGGEVGPDLTGVAKREKRDYLLESLVLPDAKIAKGYDSVVLALDNGQIQSGILKSEDAKEVRLMTPEGNLVVVPKSRIEERTRGKSAMPDNLLQHLTRREVRDLVAFLAELK